MGNKKEFFKILTFIISAIICTSAKQDFLPIIMNMPQENMQVFQILIENSLQLGEAGSSSSRSSPNSDRSKILRRME